MSMRTWLTTGLMTRFKTGSRHTRIALNVGDSPNSWKSAHPRRFRPVFGRRAVAVGVTLGLAASGLTACSFSGSAGGTGTLRMEYPNIETLDPQRVSWGEWLDGAALLEGLVTLNAKGTGAEPAVAESWDQSNDKLTYTFKLRDAKWSDGKPVTAQDFVFAYQRLLTPSKEGSGTTQGANTYLPSLGLAGAEDFQAGKLTDWNKVGVKASDPRTLQLKLAAPNADFLLGLTHPSMLPLPEHVVKAKPKAWERPENWVGNGPYVVKAWTLGSSMTLAPNKNYWDQDGIKLSAANLSLTDDPTQAGVHFQSNQIDIGTLPSTDAKRFQQDPNLKKQTVQLKDSFSSYLAVMHSKNPVLEDPRVRQALSLAMDRKGAARTCADCRPSYSLVPESVPGARAGAGVTEDVAQAKALLAQAGHPNGAGIPTIRILNNQPHTAPEAIVDSWQRNLGVKAVVEVVENGVYVSKREQLHPENYVGFYYGSFGEKPTWRSWTGAQWDPSFTAKFSLPGSKWDAYLKAKEAGTAREFATQNASPEAKRFGQLVARANAAPPGAGADTIWKQAARTRQDTYLFLPTVYTDTFYTVRSNVKGVNMRIGPLLPFNFKGVSVEGSG